MPLNLSNVRSPVRTTVPAAVEAGMVAAYLRAGEWRYMDDVGVERRMHVYGSNFNLLEAPNVQTTTLNTFTTALSGTTTALDVGKYKISLSYHWNHASAANDFVARFSFGGVQLPVAGVGELHRQEPKDNIGAFSTTNSLQKYTAVAVFFVDVVAVGTKAVLFELASESAGVESSVWGVSVEVIRVQ